MKSILSLALITFALTFCGLGDRLKQLSSSGGANTNSASNSSSPSTATSSSSGSVETPKPTAAQQSIIDSGTDVTWSEQGMSWKLPSTFKKMSVMKESLNYGAPGSGFLIASISV